MGEYKMETLVVYIIGTFMSIIMMVVYNRKFEATFDVELIVVTSIFSWVWFFILMIGFFERYMKSKNYKTDRFIKFLEGR
jgi:ABC-type dipeptide/oligopeptide/nickel transport system permease component